MPAGRNPRTYQGGTEQLPPATREARQVDAERLLRSLPRKPALARRAAAAG